MRSIHAPWPKETWFDVRMPHIPHEIVAVGPEGVLCALKPGGLPTVQIACSVWARWCLRWDEAPPHWMPGPDSDGADPRERIQPEPEELIRDDQDEADLNTERFNRLQEIRRLTKALAATAKLPLEDPERARRFDEIMGFLKYERWQLDLCRPKPVNVESPEVAQILECLPIAQAELGGDIHRLLNKLVDAGILVRDRWREPGHGWIVVWKKKEEKPKQLW